MLDLLDQSLSKRLKSLTGEAHDRLDRSIMSTAIFESRDRFAGFVAVQYCFHRDIDALYDSGELQAALPGLTERRRLAPIAADLEDLGMPRPITGDAPVFVPGDAIDVPAALGWLYVAEGSNMGAALLRKEAARLGLSDSHGARHLAPAPEGPAVHWRAFTAALDAMALSPEAEARTVAGAEAAFARVQHYVDTRLG